MKIRIKGNSIRMRLTQNEVKTLRMEGIMEEKTVFPGRHTFVYRVMHAAEIEEIKTEFKEGTITVAIPSSSAIRWAESEEVGLAQTIGLNDNDQLTVLIEKDFQCLKPRVGEDESDQYPNPLAADL